jgi:hypothetical protein
MRSLVAAMAGLLLLSRQAHAQPDTALKPSPQEIELYDGGRMAYNVGDFDTAIARWRAGYAFSARPYFLYNIAQAYRQAHDNEKALFFYKSYLREAAGAANYELVQQRVAELEALLAKSQQPPNGPLPPATAAAAGAGTPVLVVAARHDDRGPWRPRWGWLGAGGLALGGGLALDLLPMSAHNHGFDALDLVPLALYAGGIAAIIAGVR